MEELGKNLDLLAEIMTLIEELKGVSKDERN